MPDEAYSAQRLLRDLEASGAKTRVMILDACRDNPLPASKSVGGGLGQMNGAGTLVVFATSAGRTADDNPRGRNGLFTSELLKALPTPGVTLRQLMDDVSRAVYRDSGEKRQLPAIYGLLLEDFPLIAGNGGPVNPVVPSKPPDVEAWDVIGNSTNPEDFDDFVKIFPGSDRASVARLKAAALRRAMAANNTAPIVGSTAPVTPTERTTVNPKDGLTYVRIPAGRFTMGCSSGDSECFDDEKPPREVTIPNDLWVGQTLVTQAAYQRVIGETPSHFKGDPQLPVETISPDEAKNYCRAVGMRLPTEAEWEYAARGGKTGARYGSLDDIAWYSANSGNKTHEVGQKAPNAYGLYDMLGNVSEWMSDWYEGKYPSLRGGSFYYDPRYVRASYRNGFGYRATLNYSVGVRCVGE